MKTKLGLIIVIQAVLVALLTGAIASKRMPLGIPGEWEWLRVRALLTVDWLLLAGLAVAVYSVLVAVGHRALTVRRPSRLREASWLTALLAAAITIQV